MSSSKEIVCCQLQTPCFSENKNTKKLIQSIRKCCLLHATNVRFSNCGARDFFTHPTKKIALSFPDFGQKACVWLAVLLAVWPTWSLVCIVDLRVIFKRLKNKASNSLHASHGFPDLFVFSSQVTMVLWQLSRRIHRKLCLFLQVGNCFRVGIHSMRRRAALANLGNLLRFNTLLLWSADQPPPSPVRKGSK